MKTKDFYSDRARLKYNPSVGINQRSGIRKYISYDDRFDVVNTVLSDIIISSKKKVKVLDIGVGDGVYEKNLGAALRKNIHTTGIDITEKQLKRAEKYIDRGVVVNVDEQKLPYKDNSFDLVIISELLEHIFFPEKVLKDTKRVLKKGGRLVLTYPNAGALQLRLSLLLFGKSPLLNYPENQEHIRFFNHSDMHNITNLSEEKYIGLGSFFFHKFSFPYKIITPRILQSFGNKYLKGLSLGHLLILQK